MTATSVPYDPFPIGITQLPAGDPLPEAWFTSDHPEFRCYLCSHFTEALWPLADTSPAEPTEPLADGDAPYVCRACAGAIRPPACGSQNPKSPHSEGHSHDRHHSD